MMSISVHLLHNLFFWRFSWSYWQMPLHDMTRTDYSINLFLILPIYCWLWINISTKVSFYQLSLTKPLQDTPILPLTKFQVPDISTYELRTSICPKASSSSRKSIPWPLGTYPMAFLLFRTLDSQGTPPPPRPQIRRLSRGVLCNGISSFIYLPPPTLNGHYIHTYTLCFSALHTCLPELLQNLI